MLQTTYNNIPKLLYCIIQRVPADLVTTKTAIIIVETMYVCVTLRFFNKNSLMLVSETSWNALFLKNNNQSFFALVTNIFFNHRVSEVALTLS